MSSSSSFSSWRLLRSVHHLLDTLDGAWPQPQQSQRNDDVHRNRNDEYDDEDGYEKYEDDAYEEDEYYEEDCDGEDEFESESEEEEEGDDYEEGETELLPPFSYSLQHHEEETQKEEKAANANANAPFTTHAHASYHSDIDSSSKVSSSSLPLEEELPHDPIIRKEKEESVLFRHASSNHTPIVVRATTASSSSSMTPTRTTTAPTQAATTTTTTTTTTACSTTATTTTTAAAAAAITYSAETTTDEEHHAAALYSSGSQEGGGDKRMMDDAYDDSRDQYERIRDAYEQAQEQGQHTTQRCTQLQHQVHALEDQLLLLLQQQDKTCNDDGQEEEEEDSIKAQLQQQELHIRKLTQQLLRQQDKVHTAKAEVIAMQARYHAETTRANQAEAKLALAQARSSSNNGSGDEDGGLDHFGGSGGDGVNNIGEEDDMEMGRPSHSPIPSSNNHNARQPRRRIKGGVRAATLLHDTLLLGSVGVGAARRRTSLRSNHHSSYGPMIPRSMRQWLGLRNPSSSTRTRTRTRTRTLHDRVVESVVVTMDALDQWMHETMHILLHEPFARFAFLVYLALIHCWCGALVFFHAIESEQHGDLHALMTHHRQHPSIISTP